MNRERRASLDCPIDLFPRQEAEITRLTDSINQAPTAAEKAPWAQTLMEVVEILLDCQAYDEGGLNCRLCRQFSQLRRKTAELVVKAGRLDERRRS